MNSKRASSRLLLASLCLSLVVLGTGCILAPTGFLQPIKKDVELGREVAKRVEEQTGLYDDAELDHYLETVGDRLLGGIKDNPFDYSFKVIDQVEPNAFAAPGGFVYVSRGLLALTRSEDELAGVVGHEIMHVGRRHTAKQLAKSSRPMLLALPGRVVGTVINRDLGDLLSSPFDTFGQAYLASYSRGHESEADRLGQGLAAKAGYDPAALAPILERIEDDAELATGEKRKAGFFDTHPTTPNRTKSVISRAETMEWSRRSGVADGEEAYLAKLEGLLLGPDPKHGVFRGSKFMHPDLNIFLEFPEDWITVNSPLAVGGNAPDRKAICYVGIAGDGSDPKAYADAMMEYIRTEQKMEPTRREERTVGSWPAYLLVYTDKTGRDPMSLYVLWIAKDGVVLQMIGAAPETRKDSLRGIAESLRPLEPKERASIKEYRLAVVEARAGETLETVSQRTGNVWVDAKLAIANAIEPDHVFEGGERVKIAVERPYPGR